MIDARKAIDNAMSEDDLLTAIVEAALFMGWLVHHDRRSDKALQQGSSGFPDLVLARNGKVKFLELKSAKGCSSTWRNEDVSVAWAYVTSPIGIP